MRARLFARFGLDSGFDLEFGDEATIGRGKGNTVLLRAPDVSQHHARVFFDAESSAYWVEDLDSLNGTCFDGEPVRGRQRLAGLHVLSFGAAAELFFLEIDRDSAALEEPESEASPPVGGQTRAEAEAPTLPPPLSRPAGSRTRVDRDAPTLPVGLRAAPPGGESGSTTDIEESPVELPAALAGGGPAAEPPPRFVLEVTGPAGGRFVLREGENMVGRSQRARVVLRNRELSRCHATLRVAAGRVWLRDEGSRNHTFVAGRQLSEEVELEPGAAIAFGRLEARLLAEEPAAGEEEPA